MCQCRELDGVARAMQSGGRRRDRGAQPEIRPAALPESSWFELSLDGVTHQNQLCKPGRISMQRCCDARVGRGVDERGGEGANQSMRPELAASGGEEPGPAARCAELLPRANPWQAPGQTIGRTRARQSR